MGCNCGKRKQGVLPYVLKRADGTTQTFATRLEAEAQNQREGGRGLVSRKAV